MNNSLVIIIPTKNRRALLERALASVWSQEYPAVRVVVVNDGSTDDTRTYLDAINDTRLQAIHRDVSGGVNVARNTALRTLARGDWAVLLDDDDLLLPGALGTIDTAIAATPRSIEVLTFASLIRTASGDFVGGYVFAEHEPWHDLAYADMMTKRGMRGDGRSVFKAELFSRYVYAEDINGFEGEFNLLLARDGVVFRYFPEQIILIDQSHGSERLSDVASIRDPAAFARAHARIFRDHAELLSKRPDIARARAKEAFKVATRAHDILNMVRFGGYWLRAILPARHA